MDTVVLDGVQYVKASVAAKSFKYTSDYVGQLCRGKKINARLVGRTWFVNVDSIREHRRGKYKTQKEAAKLQTKQQTSQPATSHSAVKVAAPLASATAKRLNLDQGDKNEQKKLHVYYELDDELLFPKITKKKANPARQIIIKQVDAQKLKIKSRGRQTGFTPTPIPEVSLSGKLKITSYKSAPVEAKPKPKPKAEEEAVKPVEPVKVEVQSVKVPTPDKVSKPAQKTQVQKIIKVSANSSTATLASNLTQANKVPASAKVSPAVSRPKQSVEKKQPFKNKKTASSGFKKFVRFSPAIATFCAIACVGFIFSASSLIISSQSVQDSQLVLQVANLLEIFSQNNFGAK